MNNSELVTNGESRVHYGDLVVSEDMRSDFLYSDEAKEGMEKKIPYYIESLSENSQTAFKSDMSIFIQWCKKNSYCALPVNPIVLRRFMYEESNEKAPTTIERRLSTICKLHQVIGIKSPRSEPEISSAMKNIWEISEHEIRQAQPFRMEKLNLLPSVIDRRKIRDVRDIAITLLAYSTLLRRSEMARIKIEDLDMESGMDGTVKVGKIKSAKGTREVHYAYISPVAMIWIKEWIRISGAENGILFRTVNKWNSAGRNGISGCAIAESINRMGRLINVELNFTGHSTRVGAAQDLVANGIETTKAMQAGRWKDTKTFLRYSARLNASEGGMSEMFKKNNG